LKEAFPDAAFLVVSVQDKSMKKGTQFVTEPGVPKLVETQRKIALKSGVAFFNLYEAMGGQNSMNDWVNQGLAEKDYTHMKLTGAKKIADLITEALLEAGK
jgi:lysophospholipase L1-like esterase